MSDTRGQWVVVVRDIIANDDSYVGPFHSDDRAEEIATRLRRDIEAVGAEHVLEAFTAWVVPASTDFEEFRDQMLADLEVMGYAAG